MRSDLTGTHGLLLSTSSFPFENQPHRSSEAALDCPPTLNRPGGWRIPSAGNRDCVRGSVMCASTERRPSSQLFSRGPSPPRPRTLPTLSGLVVMRRRPPGNSAPLGDGRHALEVRPALLLLFPCAVSPLPSHLLFRLAGHGRDRVR